MSSMLSVLLAAQRAPAIVNVAKGSAGCALPATLHLMSYLTTANVSFTANIQTSLFQRALGTIYVKSCAIF